MANKNKNLSEAKKAKKDEFYTQLQDIANELQHYREHFRGKTVLCNCDDPYESNFFKYFALNFNSLGLRRLICTCYDGSPITGRELNLFEAEGMVAEPERKAYKIVLDSVDDVNGDGATDLQDVEIILRQHPPTLLRGSGDFRSPECVEMLREADIVCTNPPFSLFREYVAQLIEYNKKFIILGDMNAITYKEIFPLIKDNVIWAGFGFNLTFVFRSYYENKLASNRDYVLNKGYNPDEYIKKPGICWFTNLVHSKHNEMLDLWKNYTPEAYLKYDNYDAINVDNVSDIPIDYDGIMGVPITFIGKYNPEQFEIIWQGCGNTRASAPAEVLKELKYKIHPEDRGGCGVVNGKRCYARIFIRKR